MVKLFITGPPGVGKTTFVVTVYKKLDLPCGGFYTKEKRVNKERVGFEIITLDGKIAELASIEHKSPYRVGKYRVNLENIDTVAVPAIQNAIKNPDIKVIIIDEIGKMELFSNAFKDAVIEAMNSPKKVCATIKMVEDEFTRRLLSEFKVTLLKLTHENRNQLLGEAIILLEK